MFCGTRGTGKTSIAKLFAKTVNCEHPVNGSPCGECDSCKRIAAGASMDVVEMDAASNNGVEDVRNIIEAVSYSPSEGKYRVYIIDEVHMLSTNAFNALLKTLEEPPSYCIFILATTEVHKIPITILSRCQRYDFKRISIDTIADRLEEIMARENIDVEPKAAEHIAYACGGDVRKSMNAVELSVIAAKRYEEKIHITFETVSQLTQKSAVRYDKEGDEHYDLLSAFQKSMRGSDPDAAVLYLARILAANDLPSACRRLMVCACEDVGLANPQIIPIVKAAVDAAMMVGLPEARIPLADAAILVAQSPKSNSAYNAIAKAMADIEAGKAGGFPRQLQNKHYDGADAKVKGQFYLYPHDYPDHWVKQQYLPDGVKDAVYYEPGDNKTEQAYKAYWQKVKNGEHPHR